MSESPNTHVPYPTNHVVAIIPASAAPTALAELREKGFLESEIHDVHGTQMADDLAASSGHRGVVGAILRIADRLGIREDELEEKRVYEDALRSGDTVIMVHAPTEERKQIAAGLLTSHGAHFVNFMGRFTSERMKP
jgi:hypothetical protein